MLFTGAPLFAGGHFRTHSLEHGGVSGVHFLRESCCLKFSLSQVVSSLWLQMLSMVVGLILDEMTVSGVGKYRILYRRPHSTTWREESREPPVSHEWQPEVIFSSWRQCWQIGHFLTKSGDFPIPLGHLFLSATNNKCSYFYWRLCWYFEDWRFVLVQFLFSANSGRWPEPVPLQSLLSQSWPRDSSRTLRGRLGQLQ